MPDAERTKYVKTTGSPPAHKYDTCPYHFCVDILCNGKTTRGRSCMNNGTVVKPGFLATCKLH